MRHVNKTAQICYSLFDTQNTTTTKKLYAQDMFLFLLDYLLVMCLTLFMLNNGQNYQPCSV